MKVLHNNESTPKDVRKVVIIVNDNVEMHISQNKFGEIEIQKVQFGDETGALIIKPSVSNLIQIQ